MARLRDNDKKRLIADVSTGQYSVRELAKKYGVSNATIQKYKIEMDTESEQLVNAGIAYRQGLARISEPEKVNAIVNAVDEKTKHLQFITNATLKNLSSMAKKISEKTTIIEHKIAQDALDKGAITLGVAERHAKSQIGIQNNNAQQTNLEVKGYELDKPYE